MDDPFIAGVESKFLDFATSRRSIWESKHQLYSVIFEITPKCNFNCVHCYLHDHHCFNELSYTRIIEIIDILFEKEVLFITFTGGEIFTRPDFIDIYLYAKNKGFIIELYSNGYLINDQIIKILKEYPPLLIDISLYGSCDETYRRVTGVSGAFKKVMQNIKSLHEAGIRVSIKAPVLNLYYNELTAMKEIAASTGIPFRTGFEIFATVDKDESVIQYSVPLKDSLAYEFAQYDENLPKNKEPLESVSLLESRPLFRCKLGYASCVIDYQGKMCPCMSFRHIGTPLTRDIFDSIWSSYQKYPSMKATKEYKCLRCEAYDFCDICPAKMQFLHNNFEYIDEHFCKRAHARYAHYVQGIPASEVIDSI